MRLCKCKDWVENIDKVNVGFMLNLTAIGEYEGKVFVYCPWCGRKLEETKLVARHNGESHEF